MRKKIVCLLVCLLLFFNLSGVAIGEEIQLANEKNAEVIDVEGSETEVIEEIPPEFQLLSCRHSLDREKDRFVFDLNKPCEYEVKINKNRTAVEITLHAADMRAVKAISAKDKIIQAVRIDESKLEKEKIRIRIFLNYSAPIKVFTLDNPDRIIVDVAKLFVEEEKKKLGNGVMLRSIYEGTVYGPLHMEVAEVTDWNKAEALLAVARKNGSFSRSKVSTLAKENKALLAVNAGYFASSGQPLGTLVENGRLLAYPYYNRTSFIVKKDGQMLIDNIDYKERIIMPDGMELKVDGVNKSRGVDQLVLYDRTKAAYTGTNEFGLEVAVVNDRVVTIGTGNMEIPPGGFVLSAHGNRKAELEHILLDDQIIRERKFTPDWNNMNVKFIIGGGPRLVKNSRRFVSSVAEKFKPDIASGRAPRTAIGITNNNHLLIVAVSGRQSDYSIGLTLEELADYFVEWGAHDAMNFDGGGSTAICVDGELVNRPSDGSERAVSNILYIKAKDK